MKKYVLLAMLLFSATLPLTAYEYNRIGLGVSYIGEGISASTDAANQELAKEPHLFYAANLTYERVFYELPYGFSTWKISVCANPFENDCSLSCAVKLYFPFIGLFSHTKTNSEDNTSGWFTGLSPLSGLNVCSLFADEPYLYYGIGCMFGCYFVIADVFDFQMSLDMSIGIFDTPVFGKMSASLSIGYWF